MRGFKPELWTDEKFVELTPLARLLFMGLWTYACDNGHLDDRPAQIKMRVLPADSCDVDELLDEIAKSGMIHRSNGVITVPNLAHHQRLDKRYFLTCQHCSPDERPPVAPRENPVDTKGARSGHTVTPAGPRDEGRKEGSEGSERKGNSAGRGTRIPNGFAVTNEMRQWATDKHLDHLDLDDITERFVDYWRAVPGVKGVKLDWVATWHNWVKKDADSGKVRNLRPAEPKRPVGMVDYDNPANYRITSND